MERLNDSMMRSAHQRPRNAEQSPQTPRPTTSLPPRPRNDMSPRSGQMPRYGEGQGYPPEAAIQRNEEQRRRVYHQHRPLSQNEMYSHQQPSEDYHESYPAPRSADVQEEWEDGYDGNDDTTGMRYGDWEGEENEVPSYASAPAPQAQVRVEMLPAQHYAPITRQLPPLSLAHEGSVRPPSLPHNTSVNRFSSAQPPVPPKRPAPSPQSAPSVPLQEAKNYRRQTQPLDPRLVSKMTREVGSEAGQNAPSTRQVIVRNAQQPVPYLPPAATAVVCPRCKGAGYLRADVPFGHPNFGKPIACVCKEAERKEKRRFQLEEMSNLGAFRNKTFKTFNPSVSVPIQRAFKVAYDYAQDPDGWLILIGRNGCGKTHLAAAIANQRLASGSLVLFTTVPELLDHLRATFAPNSSTVYDQQFSSMREAELLVLDDLGAQQSSPWANEKLFQLLNYRYNSRFPTIITTNNTGLQNIDERVRSRLTDAALVTTIIFDGATDYRPRNPMRE